MEQIFIRETKMLWKRNFSERGLFLEMFVFQVSRKVLQSQGKISKIKFIQWTENSMGKHELSVWYRVGVISEMPTVKDSVFSFERGSYLLECRRIKFFNDMWSFWKEFWGRILGSHKCLWLSEQHISRSQWVMHSAEVCNNYATWSSF